MLSGVSSCTEAFLADLSTCTVRPCVVHAVPLCQCSCPALQSVNPIPSHVTPVMYQHTYFRRIGTLIGTSMSMQTGRSNNYCVHVPEFSLTSDLCVCTVALTIKPCKCRCRTADLRCTSTAAGGFYCWNRHEHLIIRLLWQQQDTCCSKTIAS